MPRILIVTSDLTYVPNNYYDAFLTLLNNSDSNIIGLGLVTVPKYNAIKTGFLLGLAGCPRFFFHLIKNFIELPLQNREKLFSKRGLLNIAIKDINSKDFLDWLDANKVDLIVNMRTRSIYKKSLLEKPRLGCINVHHGILPKWRGTLCDLYALSNNRRAGFSIHLMTEKLDDGKILRVFENEYSGKNYFEYLKSSAFEEGKILAEILNDISKNNALPAGIINSSSDVSYSKTPNQKTIRSLLKLGMKL